MSRPESLTPYLRFIALSARSPSWEASPKARAIHQDATRSNVPDMNERPQPSMPPRPPAAPLHVLPGEMDGAKRRPPTSRQRPHRRRRRWPRRRRGRRTPPCARPAGANPERRGRSPPRHTACPTPAATAATGTSLPHSHTTPRTRPAAEARYSQPPAQTQSSASGASTAAEITRSLRSAQRRPASAKAGLP